MKSSIRENWPTASAASNAAWTKRTSRAVRSRCSPPATSTTRSPTAAAASPRRHRRHSCPGPTLGLIEAIDRRLHLLKIPPALPRVRPRSHHRLQHPVWRDLPARHRTAPQRRGLPRRPGRPPHPRPHHGRRLLPPLHRDVHSPLARHCSRHVRLERLGRATRRVLRRRPSSTWTAPWSRPPASASRAWTSPTTAPGVITRGADPGQHRRGAEPRQPLGQSALARRGRRRSRSRPGSVLPGRLSPGLLRGDTDFSQTEHLDRWDATGAFASFSATTRCPI